MLEEIEKLAHELMIEHRLIERGWKSSWDRSKRRRGCCNYRNKVISLSKHITPLKTLEGNKNTVLHEIAHALVGPSHNHDKVWKAKAIEIGCNGERCCSETVILKGSWVGVCAHCPGKFVKARRPRKDYSCSTCSRANGKKGFSKEFLITWTQC